MFHWGHYYYIKKPIEFGLGFSLGIFVYCTPFQHIIMSFQVLWFILKDLILTFL